MSALLPDKPYFKIGEVARIIGVERHVLRYWEKEFSQVRPRRSPSGQRLYRRKDVETFQVVKDLLHENRFTIAGARQYLARAKKGATDSQKSQSGPVLPGAAAHVALVGEIKKGLLELKEILEKKDA